MTDKEIINYSEHCPYCDSEDITMIGGSEYNDYWECNKCDRTFTSYIAKPQKQLKFRETMKTHYANCDKANESDNTDYWRKTYCGLEYTESPLTDKQEFVSCKKCLRAISKIQKRNCEKP